MGMRTHRPDTPWHCPWFAWQIRQVCASRRTSRKRFGTMSGRCARSAGEVSSQAWLSRSNLTALRRTCRDQ